MNGPNDTQSQNSHTSRSEERPDPLSQAVTNPTVLPTIDPVTRAFGNSRDLYEISVWERRTRFDRLAVKLYDRLSGNPRITLLTVAAIILSYQLLVGVSLIVLPHVGWRSFLSIIPALLLTIYIWYSYSWPRERLRPLVITFALSVLFTGGAGLINSELRFIKIIPGLGPALFYFLVVAPGEEIVKLLAVRVHVYRTMDFGAVIDGAVYGAIAGLGFATMENIIYIANDTPYIIRALSAPGHVIYTAIAGYYLGLAKFNRENAGPIIAKGLLIASIFHASFNTLAPYVPPLILISVDLLALYVLLRKLRRYRSAFREAQKQEAITQDHQFDPVTVLSNIQTLYELGILTTEEYETKREEVLNMI